MTDLTTRVLPYQIGSDRAIEALHADFGLNVICQQKIGAFIALMATFERLIELAAWAVLETGEIAGTRPFTDKVGLSEIIRSIRGRSKGNIGSLGKAIDLTCDAAEGISAYRNAIAHGWLMPSSEGQPYFLSNTSWHGEKRGRAPQDAHVSENLLDLAVDSAYVIVSAARAIFLACSGPNAFDENSMTWHIDHLSRARGQANELRHLTALMNHEKY